jgi:hypothetical protein
MDQLIKFQAHINGSLMNVYCLSKQGMYFSVRVLVYVFISTWSFDGEENGEVLLNV